jgi:hypothetical protein
MLAVSSSALAAVVPRLSFDELTRGAERIVHARCMAKDTFFETVSGLIWTRYEFEIIESLKGGQEPRIVVTEPGGRYGNRGQWAPGVPQFETGNEVVLFLARTVTGKWRVYGLGQGNFRVQRDSASGATFVQADMSGIELVEMPGTPGQGPPILPRAIPGKETMDQLKQRIREQVVKQVLQR